VDECKPLAMGVIAAGYGDLTSTLGKRGGAGLERGLMLASSGACALVGVAWICITVRGGEVG